MISQRTLNIQTSLSLLSLLVCGLLAAKPMASDRKDPFSPEVQQKAFKLADGFIIELVASEKNGLINPIDLTFDDAGRLWTQTAKMYPNDPVSGINFGTAMKMMKNEKVINSDPRFKKVKRFYQLKEKGSDQILIIDDPTQNSKGPLRVWADGLTIPQSILPYKDGCYVAHGSEMFFLNDSDRDGRQDTVKTLFTNFGFFDTHTMSHSFVRGPGGQVHFSQGAINAGKVKVVATGEELDVTYCKNLRFNHEATKLEIINCWKDNIWGYQIRANGEWYGTSANDNGLSVTPMEPMTSVAGIGGDKLRSYQPFMPPPHKFRVGGTGISGLAFSEDGASGFPAEWKDVAILANPITQSLNTVRIIRNSDGAIEAQHLTDLLTCSDDWFRPVNLEFGPDGCLYIADWYNKIISHNEVTTDHPDRDRKHGRIWRIRHISQKPRTIPNLIKAPNPELVKHLSAEILWEKRAAWHQIVDRGAKELAPALQALIQDTSQDDVTRIHALWSLEGLGIFDQATLDSFLKSGNDHLVREAIRSLASFDLPTAQAAGIMAPFVSSENAMVRSQLLRSLRELGEASAESIHLLVEASKPAALGNEMGGNYERNFERFLALMALEDYQSELKSYLASPSATQMPATNILWAVQALPAEEKSAIFANIWTNGTKGEIDANTFAAMTHMLGDDRVRQTVAQTFKLRSEEMLEIALANHDRINGPEVATFYEKAIAGDLASGDSKRVKIALNQIIKLRSPAHTKMLMNLLQSGASPADQIFTALGNDRKIGVSQYRAISENENLADLLRIKALVASSITGSKTLLPDTKNLLSKLDQSRQKELVSRLSWTKPGVGILMQLYQQKVIKIGHWNYRSAQRAQKALRRSKSAQQLFRHFTTLEKVANAARAQRVQHYTKVIPTLKGNPAVGQGLFGMCLVCHEVNGGGQKIAPSLDGSANRNLEHLLTAIVNPNEAIEGAYGLYYLVKKNGESVEGYRASSGDAGVSIAAPGGAVTFIAASDIYDQGGVAGQSFMPTNFDAFPDQTMADLIAYIQSLK